MKITLSKEEFSSLADALIMGTPFDEVVSMVNGQVPDALVKVMSEGDIRVCAYCGEWAVMASCGDSACIDCVADGILP